MASYRSKTQTKYYKINRQITAPQIRLIDSKGQQIGVFTNQEAQNQARQTGLDLVEIAPKAKPPVVKLVDFAKFKYTEAKKHKAEQKKIKGGELKELQFKPFIDENDFQTKLKKIKYFLTTGNKVKISIKFFGRQLTQKQFGFDLVNRLQTELQEIGQVEGEAKFVGRQLMATLAPVKKKKNEKIK